MTKISVVIPCYEYGGKGKEALKYSFKILEEQTFKDFDVIVPDHSQPDNFDVENLCKDWKDRLDIHYMRNEADRGSPSANFNLGMALAKGEYIKFLCQDDFLFDKNSLMWIVEAFADHPAKNWLASYYIHAIDNRSNLKRIHKPTLNPKLHIVNTIGTPSCISVKNLGYELPMFDHNLFYAFDCDWYYRLRSSFGDPIILDTITIVNYLWEKSITSDISPLLINKENEYILRKYGFIN